MFSFVRPVCPDHHGDLDDVNDDQKTILLACARKMEMTQRTLEVI